MGERLCSVIVGREAELGDLRRAVVDAQAGRGRCVVLLGEPGIGKSRLAREVAGWATDRRMTVLSGRAVAGSGSAAYRPLAGALLQLLRRRSVPDDAGLDAMGQLDAGPDQDQAMSDVAERYGTVILGPPLRVSSGLV